MNGTALLAALHSSPHGRTKDFSPPAEAGTHLPTSKGWKPELSLSVRGLNLGIPAPYARSRMSEHAQVASDLTV